MSVLVLIWADETTEELCSHHPCPRGSECQGRQERLASHGRWALLLLSRREAGTGRSPDVECGPHRGALPGIFKHSQPRTFLAGLSSPPHPLHSRRPRALPLAWTTQASASSRQARSSLPDVSSLENQTIKGIAWRDKGRLFPQAWFLSGCWLRGQCSPASL